MCIVRKFVLGGCVPGDRCPADVPPLAFTLFARHPAPGFPLLACPTFLPITPSTGPPSHPPTHNTPTHPSTLPAPPTPPNNEQTAFQSLMSSQQHASDPYAPMAVGIAVLPALLGRYQTASSSECVPQSPCDTACSTLCTHRAVQYAAQYAAQCAPTIQCITALL